MRIPDMLVLLRIVENQEDGKLLSKKKGIHLNRSLVSAGWDADEKGVRAPLVPAASVMDHTSMCSRLTRIISVQQPEDYWASIDWIQTTRVTRHRNEVSTNDYGTKEPVQKQQ